ncbi:MAG: hypothetical protein SFH39_00260 [Candidatus Magnetobacterium sp. LHC-1]
MGVKDFITGQKEKLPRKKPERTKRGERLKRLPGIKVAGRCDGDPRIADFFFNQKPYFSESAIRVITFWINHFGTGNVYDILNSDGTVREHITIAMGDIAMLQKKVVNQNTPVKRDRPW